jgi:hypothetical protein
MLIGFSLRDQARLLGGRIAFFSRAHHFGRSLDAGVPSKRQQPATEIRRLVRRRGRSPRNNRPNPF